MKKYKLLKDLPFAKAGEIFESRILDDGKEYMFWGEIKTEKIENFDEWFEEVKSFKIPDEFEMGFYTIMYGEDSFYTWWLPSDEFEEDYEEKLKHHMEVGLAFPTEKEVEKHLEWLKARAILIQDTKGFKPDWSDESEWKYQVCYNYCLGEIVCVRYTAVKIGEICFETKEDAENSIKNHEKEWKIYLGVEE